MRLLPDVTTALGRSGAAGDGHAADLVLSSTTQLRFFDGVLSALAAQAEQRPLLLASEDLHGADRSTLKPVARRLDRAATEEQLAQLLGTRPDPVSSDLVVTHSAGTRC